MAIADLLFAIVAIFAVVIVFSVTFTVSEQIFPALSDKLSDDATVQQTITDSQRTFSMFDVMIVIIFFGVMIGALIAAFLLPTNPIVMGVLVIILAVVFLITPVLTNTYMEIVSDLPDVNIEVDMPYSFWMLKNYPVLIMAFGFIMFIVLVARFRSAFNE